METLPATPGAEHLARFTDWFAAQDPEALERHYVEMFDLRRKSSLYLTYYLHGDTRRRGMALLTLGRRYRAAGWNTEGGELPDHLPVVLEFAALAGPGGGEAPLRQHRRGVELIHRALTDSDSPYRHVLAALLTLLPPPRRPTARRWPGSSRRARPTRRSASTRTGPTGRGSSLLPAPSCRRCPPRRPMFRTPRPA